MNAENLTEDDSKRCHRKIRGSDYVVVSGYRGNDRIEYATNFLKQ